MRILTFPLALLLTSCVSAPPGNDERPFVNGEAVARSVVICETNLSDLQARLGAPSRDGVLGKDRVLTWIVAWEPLTKYLGVMAEQDGRVVDVYWDLPSEVPWIPANRCK